MPNTPSSSKRKLRPRKPKNIDRRSREYLTPREVRKLAAGARGPGRFGFRNFLLVTVAYRHALRVGELVDLDFPPIDGQ